MKNWSLLTSEQKKAVAASELVSSSDLEYLRISDLFLDACRDGRLNDMKKMLSQGADLCAQDKVCMM